MKPFRAFGRSWGVWLMTNMHMGLIPSYRRPGVVELALKMGHVKYVMLSYWYINKKTQDKPVLDWCRKLGIEVLLDSGAFSMMSSAQKSQQLPTVEELKAYAKEYAEFVKANEDIVVGHIELDLDNIVSPEEYREINQIVFDITGKPSILVWHIWDPVKKWADLVEQAQQTGERIAIGGVAATRTGGNADCVRLMKHLVWYANARGVRVHGLGIATKVARYIDFYSTDSFSYIYAYINNQIIDHRNIPLRHGYGSNTGYIYSILRASLVQLFYASY